MIVEKMDGSVNVESVLGEGTTFRVSLKSFSRIKSVD
jgi:signal transduction histidine kinase